MAAECGGGVVWCGGDESVGCRLLGLAFSHTALLQEAARAWLMTKVAIIVIRNDLSGDLEMPKGVVPRSGPCDAAVL